MSFHLTKPVIQMLCGRISFTKGEAFYRAKKVNFTHFAPESSTYEAIVYEKGSYQVTVEIQRNVVAQCTCPSLQSYDKYCKHIAAVLIGIQEVQRKGIFPIQPLEPKSGTENRVSDIDHQLANRMLGIFSYKPSQQTRTGEYFDTRTPLDVEFTCKLVPYGYRKFMFGIEMKVGPKRLYIVQKIREFLERMDRAEAFEFSKHFTYDPALHSFQKENHAVLRQLIQIYHNEKMYRETSTVHSGQSSHQAGERMLLIPPYAWGALLPLLCEAPNVKLVHGDHTFDGIHLSDDPIPLSFEFDQTPAENYQLEVAGLDKMTVMESYGVALYEGKLLQLQGDAGKRLSELKLMLETSLKHQIQIPPQQMESFMVSVVPGLKKLGSVRIAQTVSDRIVQTQLNAKLYLDRVKDRLLAGLEFQYGDIVINPLEESDRNRGTERILMRDVEQENRILELMEQSSFAKTEAGYFMENEEAEYDFLYHVVPQLEKHAKVYATSSVKIRLHTGHASPKVSVDVDEKTNWLEFRFEMDGIPESQIREVLKSVEEKRKYFRLPNGSLLPLEGPEFQEIGQFMSDIGIQKADFKAANIRIPAVRGLSMLDSQKHGHAVKLGKSFRRLLENMRNPDHLDFPVPESLAPVLRDYQKYGYQWMKTLAYYRFGGILADDMGLGKTLQSIAFIVSILTEIRHQKLPALIVCPASLVYNWHNELKKFAPQIRAAIADGNKVQRNRVLEDAGQADVIITSYPLLRRDVDLYAEQPFHTLIVDEAQYFKNYTTQTAQAVKELQAQYRFALTGTPVENRLEELWSIFDAVFPELFSGRKAFHDLTREQVAKRVRPFLLRRLKTEVLKELPEKIESLQASELLPEQKKLYVAYLAKLQQETLEHLNDEGFQKNRIKILAGLTRLRQLCCHPALFVEDYSGSSAKLDQLLEILEECRRAGRRTLVFSQFTEMLGLISKELGYQGAPFFYLDGKTPAAERVELCNRFNEGERDLFLISLKAGGTGLNLTGADTVILYDLWWNPAVEQQATDRAHRIGQKKVVQVIRLITQGTVEDKMYELQQKKKNLIEEVVQPGQEALSTLTEQEIREILMIK